MSVIAGFFLSILVVSNFAGFKSTLCSYFTL